MSTYAERVAAGSDYLFQTHDPDWFWHIDLEPGYTQLALESERLCVLAQLHDFSYMDAVIELEMFTEDAERLGFALPADECNDQNYHTLTRLWTAEINRLRQEDQAAHLEDAYEDQMRPE